MGRGGGRLSGAARGAAAGAAVLVGFVAAWAVLHPAPPLEPGADLYDNLAVARHLARGEGFRSDIVYPLSLAFPFARDVPQPLVSRPPGWPLLLTLPVAAARGEPGPAVARAQQLAMLLLGLTALAGALAANRAGLAEAVPPWLTLLLASPLLAMTTGWAQSETLAALLLVWLWQRARSGPAPAARARGAGVGDGLLAGALALVRLDLAWVPWLWLAARRRLAGRAGVACAVAWLALLAPWGARNAALTGNPLFTLQAYAEHLKETPAWPEYSIYRSLSPEPYWRTLARDPGAVAAKTAAGARWFASRLHRWVPWPLWIAALLLALPRRGRGRRDATPPGAAGPAPLRLLLLTAALLMLQYAALSHTLRYLGALLPALSLEIWLALAAWLRGWRPDWRPATRAFLLWGGMAGVQAVTPARVPGWTEARRAAAAAQPAVTQAVARARALPSGPLFTDSAAVPYLAGRPAVWLPLDATTEARVRAAVPALAGAPVVRLHDAPARP